jgi:diguanylate cyclase (GGDEF)-like protein
MKPKDKVKTELCIAHKRSDVMKDPKEYQKQKQYEIHRERQMLSIGLYVFLFILGTLATAFSLLNNPVLDEGEGLRYLLFILLFDLVVFAALYLCYRMKDKLILVDTILFTISILLYGMMLLTSPRMKILNVGLWLPVLVMFIFSIKSRLFSLLFFMIHMCLIIFYFVQYPTYTFEVSQGTYINLIAITLLVAFSMKQLVKLNTKYENTIFNDYKQLEENNIELVALNEEYYAAQEELMSQYDEIQFLAYNDSLTQLLNRSGLIKALTSRLNHSRDLMIAIIDISKFNQINSVYGYSTGDHILISVGDHLNRLVNDSSLISRIGDDAFAIVCEKDNSDASFLETLNQLPKNIVHEQITIHLTYNYGIASCHDPNDTPDDIIKKAEAALLKAKSLEDKPYYIYTSNLLTETERQMKLFHALKHAIEACIIQMHYQPIYNTQTKAIHSFEALARWQDSTYGFIPPNQFIDIAENSTLIHHLGEYILAYVSDTIDTIVSNHGDHKYDHISINVSAKELARKSFSQDVIDYFSTRNIDPHRIGIEVTETGLIGNTELAKVHLSNLRSAGFIIYLDDFGTGYSSLSYLDSLPIDILKIDKSFIDQIPNNSRKQALLKSIVDLAKSLHIETVAEGVETEEEYLIIKDIGVTYTQGYYFSKPIPNSDVLKYLEQ